MDFTKIVPADWDSPCREFSNGGLGIVLVLTVFLGIDFSFASTGSAFQLYVKINIDRLGLADDGQPGQD